MLRLTRVFWLAEPPLRPRTLHRRARTRSLAPYQFYTDDYVRDAGNGTWYVWLDMTITERVAGEVVKDDVIRYPLYAYLDSRSCNQFGVAIGGFFAGYVRL